MTDFLAAEDQALLQRHGLDSFEALWARQLAASLQDRGALRRRQARPALQ